MAKQVRKAKRPRSEKDGVRLQDAWRLQDAVHLLREQRGLTQPELADLSGVPQTTISRVETGKTINVRANTLRGLADALGVTVAYMAGFSRAPHGVDWNRMDSFTAEIVAALDRFEASRRERVLNFVRLEEEQRKRDEARRQDAQRKRAIARDTPKRGSPLSAAERLAAIKAPKKLK